MPEYRPLLEALLGGRVELVVVGGVAAVLQGAPVATFDLDVVHRRTETNVAHLLDVLSSLDAKQRGDLRAFRPTAEGLLAGGHHLLATRLGPVNLLGAIGGGVGFEELAPGTLTVDLEGLAVPVLGLSVLIELSGIRGPFRPARRRCETPGMADADPNDPYARLSYRRLIAWPARIQREAPFLREVLAGAPSKRLLDLGCGTGEHARFLQEEGFDVTGVDASEAQLAQAREAGPGPAFVKGDLAELGSSVTGPFGAAISLGNGLPHLHAPEMARFLEHLARLLAPGAPVLFQLLNYDRILDGRVTSLPLNVREDEGERVVFLRLMDPRPDGTVLFNPTTLRWRPGAEPPVEVLAGKNVVLKGWRRAELEAALGRAGFRVEAAFGGVKRERWDAAASSDTVLLARR